MNRTTLISTCMFVLIASPMSHAEPTYCAQIPDSIADSARSAELKQKHFNQQRDDARADSKSRKQETTDRTTASDDDGNVTMIDFGNHDLDSSREDARRAKESLIQNIVNANETEKPSLQLKHWMACDDVHRALTKQDLNEPWAKRQVHRFDTRWDQVRRGVKMDEQASIESRSIRHGKVAHVSAGHAKNQSEPAVLVAESSGSSFGDDSPQIATHKMSVENLSRLHMVTTNEPATRATSTSKKANQHKVAAHHFKKSAHVVKVAKNSAAAQKKFLAKKDAAKKKNLVGAHKAICSNSLAKGASKGKVCAKRPSRGAASTSEKVAKI